MKPSVTLLYNGCPCSQIFTTALTLSQAGSVGSFLFIIMKCFVLSSLLSISLAAPAPEAAAAAEAAPGYPLLAHHIAPLAVVPLKQLQWPGVSAPGVDTTCFGCRAHAVVPLGRRRRSAEADAEAGADAYHTSLNGYAHNLGSGNSFSSISSAPALPYVHGVAAYPAAYGYPHPYLG